MQLALHKYKQFFSSIKERKEMKQEWLSTPSDILVDTKILIQ